MARRSPEQLREVIRDFRRDQIVEVATRLFGERGSTEVPMDDIATEAGVARSTVYVYFANRDEVLRACVKAMYLRFQEAIAGAFAGGTPPPQRLRAVVWGMLQAVDENRAFFRVAMAAQGAVGISGSEAVDAELWLIGLDMARLLEDLVAEGTALGTFRPIDPPRGAALIGQQILGGLTVRSGDPTALPLDEATDEICEFLLYALRAGSTDLPTDAAD